MSVQILVYWPIPFPGVLIKISGIPKILIELSITETSEFSIKIRAKIENQEEHRKIQSHNWKIPAWKNKL